VLGALAWIRATSPRNGGRRRRAVRLAERACALTENGDANALDTLARVCGGGTIRDAVRTGRQALEAADAAPTRDGDRAPHGAVREDAALPGAVMTRVDTTAARDYKRQTRCSHPHPKEVSHAARRHGAPRILFAAVVWPLLRRARREAGEIVPLAVSPAAPLRSTPVLCRTLRVYFIKPSKYDDRGAWRTSGKACCRTTTLTVLAALNEAYNRLHDDDAYVETVIWDEQVDGPVLPRPSRASRKRRSRRREVIVGLAGVQTTSTRAGATWRSSSAAPASRPLGGFHVSGYPESRAFLESCGSPPWWRGRDHLGDILPTISAAS